MQSLVVRPEPPLPVTSPARSSRRHPIVPRDLPPGARVRSPLPKRLNRSVFLSFHFLRTGSLSPALASGAVVRITERPQQRLPTGPAARGVRPQPLSEHDLRVFVTCGPCRRFPYKEHPPEAGSHQRRTPCRTVESTAASAGSPCRGAESAPLFTPSP